MLFLTKNTRNLLLQGANLHKRDLHHETAKIWLKSTKTLVLVFLWDILVVRKNSSSNFTGDAEKEFL